MKIELGDPRALARVEARILAMLLRSPWRRPTAWKHAVVVIHPERRSVISRAQAAAELRGADLLAAAHEVSSRHVGRGQVIAWIIVDRVELAEAGFLVVDLLGTGKAGR